MKRNTLPVLFCCIICTVLYGCIKKPKHMLIHAEPRSIKKNYVYLLGGKPVGILRVECSDCQLVYTVNHEEFTMDVKDGNEDRFIYPKPNTYVKTLLKSHTDQMIRVLAINPNGKIVSNVLDTFSREQQAKNKYLMQCLEFKNTVHVDILKK